MAQKDIYKIDNYFITIGVIFLILGLISIFGDPRTYNPVVIDHGNGSYTFESRNGRTLEEIQRSTGGTVTEVGFPIIRTSIGINGLILLLIGGAYRKRENKIITVWNALDRTGEVKVNNLAASLGIEREFILRHLKDINAQQGAYYEYDTVSDKIVDGKLMAEFMVVVDCKNCGGKLNERISIELAVMPTCKYCGSPVSTAEELNKMKREVLATRPEPVAEKKDFNVAIFIALLLFFWPGAIFYLIKKKS